MGAQGVPLDHERDGRGVVALGAPRHRLPQPEHPRTKDKNSEFIPFIIT